MSSNFIRRSGVTKEDGSTATNQELVPLSPSKTERAIGPRGELNKGIREHSGPTQEPHKPPKRP